MALLRWIAFLPLAVLSAIVAGALGYYLVDRFGAQWFNAGHVVPWIASGAGSSAAFLAVGTKIAPAANAAMKWPLVGLLFIAGVVSAVGALLGGTDRVAAIPGLIMVLTAISVVRRSPQSLKW